MNARAMMTMNAPARLERSHAPRSWLAVVLHWSMLARRAQSSEARFGKAGADILPRRRRDRHPDAPPPRPLLASRDLPPAKAVNILAEAGPIIETIAPPRSPEPMSDTQIAQLLATATARALAIPVTPPMLAPPALPAPAPASRWPRLPRVVQGKLASPMESPATSPARLPDQPDMDAAAVEAALAKALATLRKLAEQAPANRWR